MSTDTPKKKWGGKREPLVVDELLTRQMASLLLTDTPMSEIATQLNLSYTSASKLAKRADVRDMLKEAGEQSLAAAKSLVRKRASELANLAIDVLKEKLEEDRDLEAVKVTLKVLGALEPETQTAPGATAIQVILPSSQPTEPKDIEIQSEE